MSSLRSNHAPARRRPGAPFEELLRLLARSADGVFAVDSKQRVIFWSDAAEALLGQPAADVVGKPCYQVMQGSDYDGQPFCRPDCPTIVAARRGRSMPNYDITCRRNGGELRINVSTVPVPRDLAAEATAVHMIRDVARRRSPERLAQGADKGVSGSVPGTGPMLTARELEVLRLLADGSGTQDLAQRLGLSRTTVRNHIQRLTAKLGAHSRLEAVVIAARRGLI